MNVLQNVNYCEVDVVRFDVTSFPLTQFVIRH